MSFGPSGSAKAKAAFEFGLRNGVVLLDRGGDADFTHCVNEHDIEQLALELTVEHGARKHSASGWFVNQFKNKVKVGDLIVATAGSERFRGIAEVTGEYQYLEVAPLHHGRAARWLAVYDAGYPMEELYPKEIQVSSLSKLDADEFRFTKLEELLSAGSAGPHDEAHVLIIDEINRANVSKVFGELITLIEPDKREGMESAVTVKLPYSGDDFLVPGNLHLIGTMNTADRSIALLDTALRRRFEFIEVAPEPGLLKEQVIEGIELDRLLQAINSRVEALYDRDHMIGHAYLMNVKTMSGLEDTFRKKILPLLQEYFFENWSKVRRVLNDLADGDFIRKAARVQIPSDGDDGLSGEATFAYSMNPAPFPVSAFQRIYQGA